MCHEPNEEVTGVGLCWLAAIVIFWLPVGWLVFR